MKFMKLFTLVFLTVLLIGSVSAWDFDNVKSYDEETKTVSIVNAFGLGDVIARIKLNTPLEYNVGVGYQKVAEFTITQSYDGTYDNALDKMDFYNVGLGMEKFERNFDYKYKTIETYEVESCSYIDNKTIDKCSMIEHERVVWNEYTGKDVLKGDITIGVFTNTVEGEKVEWIPTYYGIEIEEWATWTAGLNTDLYIYYNMEEASSNTGIVLDQIDHKNGTNILAVNVTGKVDYGYWLPANSAIGILNLPYTSIILGTGSASNPDKISIYDGSDWLKDTTTTLSDNTWFHVAVITDGTTLQLYINGAWKINFTTAVPTGSLSMWANITNTGVDGTTIFKDYLGAYQIGHSTNANTRTVDEFGWWNRTLSPTEITQLYNGGTGITWTDVFIVNSPLVDLVSPINAFNSTSRTVTFNTTVTDNSQVYNVSLYLNGTLNETNSSHFNGTYAFTKSISEGFHNWSIIAYDNNTQINISETRNFTVDTSPTIYVVSPPANNTNYTTSTVYFNATTDLAVDYWIVNYNGTNLTLSNINTSLEVEDGSHRLFLYANNSLSGVFGVNDSIYFNVDATLPIIVINSGDSVEDYGNYSSNHTINFTATDSNIDYCILNYHGVNTTIAGCLSGVLNSTEINETTGFSNATIWVNDTFGNWNSTYFEWDYRIFEGSQHYVSPVVEGTTNLFQVNLTSNSTVTQGYLYYNGSRYLGTISSVGDVYVVQRNHVAPVVDSQTNFTFFWDLTTGDGYKYNLTDQNQTVNPLVVNSTCSAGMYLIYNFTLVNELTQDLISEEANNTMVKTDMYIYSSGRTTTIAHYYHEFEKTNYSAICMDNNLSTGSVYSVDVQVEYDGDAFANEMYYIEKYNLNESSMAQNITLYDLPDAQAQDFKIVVRDTTYLPLSSALIEIQRKYIENGTYYIVELPKTDAQGLATASLQLNDAIYNFYVYEDGTLKSSFLNVNAICHASAITTCEIDLTSPISAVNIYDYEEGDDFNFTIGYNSTTRIVSSVFAIPSGVPSTVNLTVISENTLSTSVCTDTLLSASGTLSCVVPASFGNSTISASLYKDDVEQGYGNIKLDQDASDIYGGVLIFLGFLVFITLLGIGMSDNPIVTVVFLMVSVIVMMALNLINNTGYIGATATFLFFAICVVLVLIKASRRN